MGEYRWYSLGECHWYIIVRMMTIYEADIRIALAWAQRAAALTLPSPTGRGSLDAARAEAERARRMSVEMGYH